MKCDLETTSALAALLTEFAPEPLSEGQSAEERLSFFGVNPASFCQASSESLLKEPVGRARTPVMMDYSQTPVNEVLLKTLIIGNTLKDRKQRLLIR